MTSMNSSEASSSMSRPYQLFLSFRGSDTRYTFTDYLYTMLEERGYKVFRDKEGITNGQTIQSTLQVAIQESKLSIVVLSTDYASSKWCLDELVMIMNRHEKEGHTVLPVFYHVEPSDVRNQRGSFAESFVQHEEFYREKLERVEGWRVALRKIGELKGEHVKEERYWAEVIQSIVQDVGSIIGNGLRRNLMDPVFHKLRFNYDRLAASLQQCLLFCVLESHRLASSLRQCLLYCALFPEDTVFYMENLIDYLIDEGVIERRNCRWEEVDEGQVMLTNLVNLCLLEDHNYSVKMQQCLLYCALFFEDFRNESERLIEYLIDERIVERKTFRREEVMLRNPESLCLLGKDCHSLELLDFMIKDMTYYSVEMHDLMRHIVLERLRWNNISEIGAYRSTICSSGRLQMISDSSFEEMVSDLSHIRIQSLPQSTSAMLGLSALVIGGCCVHIMS